MFRSLCYSLAPGVSFDLLQRLYKLEHHTVLCCSAYIRYMHCGPDICTAELSVMITPAPQAINQLKHPIVRDLAGIHALRPRASCMYTSQIPHWGVLTNTY